MPSREIKTYQEIVDTITTNIGNKSTNLTDFSEGSNIRAIVDSIANFVEFLQLQNNIAFEAFSLANATGDNLKNRGKDFGVTFREAIAASGIIKFTRNSPATAAFSVYAGSQISTHPDVFGNTIDYTVNADIVFPSGATYVTGAVTCLTTGITGNVPVGYITNITGSIPGINTVINEAALISGSDEETEDAYRQRIVDTIGGLKKANEASIRAAATSISGVTVVRVEENNPSNGQITVYVSSQSGAFTTEQLTAIKAAVEDAAAFGIVVNIVTPSIVYVVISADVTYDAKYQIKETLQATLKQSIYDFITKNPETTLKWADLLVLIRETTGVSNVKNLLINGENDDYSSDGFSVIRIVDRDASTTLNMIAG